MLVNESTLFLVREIRHSLRVLPGTPMGTDKFLVPSSNDYLVKVCSELEKRGVIASNVAFQGYDEEYHFLYKIVDHNAWNATSELEEEEEEEEAEEED